MSPDLQNAAERIAQLMRQRRREITRADQLVARLGRIIRRQSEQPGLTGLLGGDAIRQAAGIRRPEPLPVPEPRPVKRTVGPAEPREGAAPEVAEVAFQKPPRAVEAEEPAEALREEETAPEPELAAVMGGFDLDVVSDIKAAAAEAAAVEALAEAIPLLEEAAGKPARGTARPRVAPPSAGAAKPGEEPPFELAVEPRALVPGQLEFVRAPDEVLFRRAIDYLGSRDIRGMREGIEMLGRIAGEAAATVLKNLYSIAPARWRPDVAHQLVNHPARGIKEFFCQVLDRHDEPPVVRIAALRALYARDKALAAEYLLKALGDEGDEVRAAAAAYLGWLREKRAMPVLEQLVGDRSQAVANAALHASALIRL